ncbi:Arc-like DNA binding domain protein [Variovorax sp. PBS-H4]|uniref:FitA-like ribbon-helix-helix domain-containing protein n=1 Tax=Variovorax sp. PBS-H4 TaxID=434008 RepID=UPI00131703CD|nr:Arc family DNA-binding protein [Variovorax sp. PBS-H4]VTU19292.1 Arc-like DNA binding domain protein [Variovorax sp. PBS-H4]
MVNLSIKDVPEDLAERLRQRAARNHRSLQGELMALLEQAFQEPAPPPAPMPRPGAVSVGWNGYPVMRRGGKPIEQIAAEIRSRHPEPARGAPDALEILRAKGLIK